MMNSLTIQLSLAAMMGMGAGIAQACDYTPGETEFVEYANCRYGEDSVLVVDLPESASWEHCVYFVQAFRPEKLLAVTKLEGDREVHSINNRSQIGNPCYLTKQQCDKALKIVKASGY